MRRAAPVLVAGAAGLVLLVTVVREPSAPVTVVTDVLRWALGPSVAPRTIERSVAAAANVVLFVPLGAALALGLGGRRPAGAVAVAAGLSVAVETAQWLWLPRSAQVSDVALNTLGAVAGVLLVRGRGPRSGPPRSDGARPSRTRP